MKVKGMFLLPSLVLFLFAGNASALDDIVSDVQKGCEKEIKTYCSQVSPGQNRMLACFFAHEDKLSGVCAHSLYDASVKLGKAITALNYMAEQCMDDVLSHCADVEMGEGRVAQCLKSNAEAISPGCKKALPEVKNR